MPTAKGQSLPAARAGIDLRDAMDIRIATRRLEPINCWYVGPLHVWGPCDRHTHPITNHTDLGCPGPTELTLVCLVCVVCHGCVYDVEKNQTT